MPGENTAAAGRRRWLDGVGLRVGLGCMRLSTDKGRDEGLALGTVAAAAEAGVTVYDTARTYRRVGDDLGGNERLLATALRRCGAHRRARIVTKGGMTRSGDAWVPDGRAKVLAADCEASLAALDGLAISLYLVHAPDPRTPWPTTLRALARLADEGLVEQVGVANVNRRQLDEALALAPVAAVEVGLSLLDDRAVRGGVVERCAEAGLAVLAHSPLGGPRRVGRLLRDPALASVADTRRATPAEVALAWLLGLSETVVPIPGAGRPESARSAARAAELPLDGAERERLARAFGWREIARHVRPGPAGDRDVVLIMGIPGAGKSRVAEALVADGYTRLNRDQRGGSMRAIAAALDDALAAGDDRVVLDNTYLSRASRSHVVEAAARHQARTRCLWLDTPLAQAQVNLVLRLLDRVGSLPSPERLRELARREPGILSPTSQMRALRELEPPTLDEGFAEVDRLPFTRSASEAGRTRPGVFVSAAALREPGWKDALRQSDPDAPHLVFDWLPEGAPDALGGLVATVAGEVPGPVEGAVCPHGAGPPVCWCRPPLPGLMLEFARAHAVDPARSVLIGSRTAHRTLATTLGARFVPV